MVFSNFMKVSGTYTVDLAIEKPRDVVYKHFGFVCFVFHGAAPIPYLQAAILNLPHAYLSSTTVLTDSSSNSVSAIPSILDMFIHIIIY